VRHNFIMLQNVQINAVLMNCIDFNKKYLAPKSVFNIEYNENHY